MSELVNLAYKELGVLDTLILNELDNTKRIKLREIRPVFVDCILRLSGLEDLKSLK